MHYWLLHQFGGVFHRPLAIRLKGVLDRSALAQAMNEIVRRHEALRTVFPDHDGEPWQMVLPSGPTQIDFEDLRHLAATQREAASRDIAAVESRQRFELVTGPLFRVKLLRLNVEDHVLLVLMHHIVFDAWSEHLFLRELKHLYHAYSRQEDPQLPELPIQYADFSVWQAHRLREQDVAKQLGVLEERTGRDAGRAGPVRRRRQGIVTSPVWPAL